ncbi:MAG: universal stress protein [Mucilaginibacter sp.]
MASILILTDFSEASFRAADWAALLVQKGHVDLTVYHSYTGAANTADSTQPDQYFEPRMAIRLNKKHRNILAEYAQYVECKISEYAPDSFKPRITIRFGEGSLKQNIRALTAQNDIELVIMGAANKILLGHTFMSSSVLAVIERTTKPVLVVPVESPPKHLQNAIFAVKLNKAEINVFHRLAHLANLFSFNIELLHVITDNGYIDDSASKALIRNLCSNQPSGKVTFSSIKCRSIVSGIYEQCQAKAPDLLVITHRQYSLMRRLFHKSIARQALRELPFPILIFPSNIRTAAGKR